MGHSRVVLGLDLGTTSVKALALDQVGTARAWANSPPLELLPSMAGHAEQEPAEIWSAVIDVLRTVLSALDASDSVVGLAVAAQSGSVMPIGNGGEPTGPLITWMDRRAEPLVQRWTDDGIGSRIRSITGWSPAPGLGLSLIGQLRAEEAAHFESARRFVGLDTFVVHRLTGEWVTNPSNAAGLQLMELESERWSDELCELAGIEADMLVPIEPSGVFAGAVTRRAAAETGLPVALPVFNGGHDQSCTALGLGLLDPGDLLLSGGTAWVLTAVTDTPALAGLPPDVNVGHHVVPGRFTRSQLLGAFGAAIEELLAERGTAREQDPYDALDAEVAATSPTRHAPHFDSAQFFDGSGRLIPRDRLSDLTRGERARAIVEHAGFQLREALGDDDSEVTLVGGAAVSSLWRRVLADAAGHDIVAAPSPSWPAIGASVIAGVGAGVFESLEAGVARVTRDSVRTVPDPALANLYRGRMAFHAGLTREDQ